jgi:hypothetical protein
MLAVKLLNTMGHLAAFGDQPLLVVEKPTPEVIALGAKLAAAVPAAWWPCRCGGLVGVAIEVPSGKVVQLAIHGLEQPPDWRAATKCEERHVAWLKAGVKLGELAAAAMVARDEGMRAAAPGSN